MITVGWFIAGLVLVAACHTALMMKLDLERAIGEISGIRSADRTARVDISNGFVTVNHKNGCAGYSITGLANLIKKEYSWWL